MELNYVADCSQRSIAVRLGYIIYTNLIIQSLRKKAACITYINILQPGQYVHTVTLHIKSICTQQTALKEVKL